MTRETISIVVGSKLLKELEKTRGLANRSRLIENYIEMGLANSWH